MKCVIVGGADIKTYERVKTYIHEDDFIIACDSGLNHLDALGVQADLIVGDFDSYQGTLDTEAEVIRLPKEKDDTDTVYALREGLKRGFDEFLLLGVVGNRFDHSFVNVAALLKLNSLGIKALIVDDYCEMEVVSNEGFVAQNFAFFSLLNISGEENEISIENAKFTLDHGSVSSEYQFATSNEVLPQKIAKITLHKGRVLLIRDF